VEVGTGIVEVGTSTDHVLPFSNLAIAFQVLACIHSSHPDDLWILYKDACAEWCCRIAVQQQK